MRILFIGAVSFSAAALRHIIALRSEIVGVCTLQQNNHAADHHDLTTIADSVGIPVYSEPDLNTKHALDWMRRKEPDVILCLGWSRLLKRDVLTLPRMGVIGYHPARLPENRGRHPLIWSLVLGLEEIGSTFFFMDEGADSGDIISQEMISVGPDDDAASLYEKMTATALLQLEKIVSGLAGGTVVAIRQNHARSNSWRKRVKADGRIDWRMSAKGIHNLVRALAKPYPGAHFELAGHEYRVWSSRVVPYNARNDEPGKVLRAGADGLLVKTGEDAILLLKIDPPLSAMPGDYL